MAAVFNGREWTEVPTNHEIIFGKRTVAFLDILGFKNLMTSMNIKDLAEVYEQAVNEIQFITKRKPDANRLSLFPEHPVDLPYCKTFIFSDSIIMISNGPGASETLKTLICAWRTVQSFVVNGIPVRGAVAFGDMYINLARNIFLGPALTRAAELEGHQEWVGAVIDDDVLNQNPQLKNQIDESGKIMNLVFRRYPVPFKDRKGHDFYTLNWRACLVIQKGVRSLFEFTGVESVDVKFRNTLNYCEGGKGGGEAGNTPIEFATAWAVTGPPPYTDPD
jgi:hypothetical protein